VRRIAEGPASAISSSLEASTWAAASVDRRPPYALTTLSIDRRKMKQGEAVMDVTLSADLRAQVDQELASGHYQGTDDLIGQAIRHFLDERQRGQRRLDALRRIGQAVDQAGLYERVLIPDQQ
jgi:Arc/MetJ-type ribon-helix-helix transcriptional regulator